MPTPLVNQHSITSTALKVERQMLHDFFSSLFSCGAHSACNGQGHTSELRVPGCAACSGMMRHVSLHLWLCFLRLRSRPVADVGCWWMVPVDGALHGVVWDRYMARRQQVRWKGCFTLTYFYWDFSGLLQVGLFLFISGGLCMLSFLSLFVFGKERRISSKKMTKARKDFIQKSRQRKNATEDESNLPHMLASRWKQPATHACKLVFTNTRQQAAIMSDNRKTKNQVKK